MAGLHPADEGSIPSTYTGESTARRCDQMTEQVYVQVSEACARKGVRVRLPLWSLPPTAALIPGYGVPAQLAKLGRPGSIPGRDTVAEPKAVAGPGCEPGLCGF